MKKGLIALDITQLVLSIVGMFIFAFIFFVVDSMQRYLFLACLVYAGYVFINAWQELELDLAAIKVKKEGKVKEFKKISA
jgi:hypothetical protein